MCAIIGAHKWTKKQTKYKTGMDIYGQKWIEIDKKKYNNNQTESDRHNKKFTKNKLEMVNSLI